uniref:Uncharacterized protein n=1 Tax=viral metagenome TaxID=1070528 RepID=A0A6M3J396_9ZZZZ
MCLYFFTTLNEEHMNVNNANSTALSPASAVTLTSGGADKPDPPAVNTAVVESDTVTLSDEATARSAALTSGGADKPDPPQING